MSKQSEPETNDGEQFPFDDDDLAIFEEITAQIVREERLAKEAAALASQSVKELQEDG